MDLSQPRSCHRLVSSRWPLRLAKGCRMCKLLGTAVKQYSERQAIAYREIYLVRHEDASYSTYEFYELKLFQGSQQEPHFMRFYPNEAFLREHEKRYASTQDLSFRAQQSRRLSSAKLWLDTCMHKHPRCRGAVKDTLPTRLLYLDSQDRRAILVDTATVTEVVRYACLSHCWGQIHPIRTVQSNLASLHSSGLQFDALPPTFRDAVESCLSLQLHYLWIDSLCIVQDDKDDWLREAQRMASIYSSAVVTIAAARAPDCQEGFLSRPYKTDILQIQDRTAGSGFIVGVTSHEISWGRSSGAWIRQSPLVCRAWTLQESLLSPRSLIFGFEDVSWECLEMTQCECGSCEIESASGEPKYESKLHLYDQLEAHTSRQSANPDAFDDRAFYLFWMGLVSNYVSRRITYDADRLVALAGIMDLVEKRTGQKCYAGHWASHFIDSLLWSTDRGRRPTVPRAPSWSWASVETSRLNVWDLDTQQQNPRPPELHHPFAPTLVSIDCPNIGLVGNDNTAGKTEANSINSSNDTRIDPSSSNNVSDNNNAEDKSIHRGTLTLDAWVIETRLTPKVDWHEGRDGLATRWRCSCFAQANIMLDDRETWRSRNAWYDVTLVLLRQLPVKGRNTTRLLFLICMKEGGGAGSACLTRIGMGEQRSDEGNVPLSRRRVEIQ